MIESTNSVALSGDTKLQNAAFLMARYNEILRSEAQYALVQINIKNFRYFNSKYGTKAGDEILQLVLQTVLEVLEPAEYGAHLYSDNFGILMKHTDMNELLYGRVIPLVDQIYRINDERIYRNLFTSVGMYAIEDSAQSFCDALNLANLCRKECGTLFNRSNCMEIYEPAFYDQYVKRLNMEAATAEAYKNYEFVTYLQPKVDLRTGEIVGAEALLRWFDADGAGVPLYSFLPILNQNGYIQLIDLDTFDQMCRYLDDRIKRQQRVVPISFNLSKSAFYNPNIIKEYTGIFEQYDIPKELIEIELMESISMDDTARMKAVIGQFADYGFRCALDDFGNGYSSFNVLLNAQLDIVKMDRQFFVTNLNGNAQLVIKTIVDLIHSLHFKVVAEGVDAQEHIDFLRECGCDYVQGYYFYKPMAITQFDALLDVQHTSI